MIENCNTGALLPPSRHKAPQAEPALRKEARKESRVNKPGASCALAAVTAFAPGRAGL